MIRFWMLLYLITSAAVCAGCSALFALATVAAVAASEVRLSSTPCRGLPCDRANWMVVGTDGGYGGLMWPEAEAFGYEYAFIPRLPDGRTTENVISASMRRSDQRLALVTDAGRLILAELGDPEALAIRELGAVGVGWSNAGDRIAVAVQSAGATPYVLNMLTSELVPVGEFELDMPPRDDSWTGRLVISWSADDSLVAVSTDVVRAPDVPLRAVVFDARAGGVVAEAELATLFFLGTDTLLGVESPLPWEHSSGDRGEFVVVEIGGSGLQVTRRVRGPQKLLASDPPTGVFATIEPSFFGMLPTYPVGLRTLDHGPDLVSGRGYTPAHVVTVLLAPR